MEAGNRTREKGPSSKKQARSLATALNIVSSSASKVGAG